MQSVDPDQLKGIGFAMPGPFDYVNGICLMRGVSKYENLYGINVGDELCKFLALKSRQDVRFINDVSAFAIGEAKAGKAAGAARSMVITIGTGIGSAFIRNGIPVVSGSSVPEKLPSGTPDDVRADVLKRCEVLSRDGGFIFAPIHNILPEVPPVNIVAMYEAVKEFHA